MLPSARLLLILMIALLPLRSFALAVMTFEPAGGVRTQAYAKPATAAPCHAEHGEEDSSAVEPTWHHGCSLCELCHLVVVPLLATGVRPDRVVTPAPRADRITGLAQHQPGPLDRPPRA